MHFSTFSTNNKIKINKIILYFEYKINPQYIIISQQKTNQMHLSNSIKSLDQFVLQDELLQILQRSPQTTRFVGNRVSQIITQIISVPIIQELQQKVAELEQIIGQLQEEKEVAGMSHSKQSQKNKNVMQRYILKNKQLEKDVQALRNVQKQNEDYKQQIEKLQKAYGQLQNELNIYKQENEKIEQNLQENRNKNDKLQEELDKLRKQHGIKCQQVYKMEGELQKVKRLCKQTKYNEIGYKKQGQKIKQDFETTHSELSRLKQQLRVQKVHRDNERKALNAKINQFYNKSKNVQKLKKHLIKLSQQNKQVRQQLDKLKESFLKQIKKLSEESSKNSYLLMDEIGDQVNRQLKQLMTQMTKTNAQARIYREEAKIKDEIIEKLEKVSTVQVMGNRQLQKQLRSKKMEADSLRKQLKKNYEQSENRLMGLENNYRQMLTSTITHSIR